MSKTVLIYDGIDITEADKDSLKENQYVVDNIISFAIANYYIKNKQKIDDKNIVLVRPPQAMMLKAGDKLTVRNLKKVLKMKGYSSVVIPVNDAVDLNKWSGGGHWTVLVWNIEKNSFHHLDSIPGKNIKHAKELAANLMDGDCFDREGNLSGVFIEVEKCGTQKNGYDCGLYVIHYMISMAENNINADSFEEMNPPPEEMNELRKIVNRQIEAEIKIAERRNKPNDEPSSSTNQENSHDIMNDYLANKKKTATQKINNPNERNKTCYKCVRNKNNNGKTGKNDISKERRYETKEETRDCWFFAKKMCRYGNMCRYKHNKLCTNWEEEGDCNIVDCRLSHPEKCKYFFKGICNKRNCHYLHPSVLLIGRRDTQNNRSYQRTTHKVNPRYDHNHTQSYNQDHNRTQSYNQEQGRKFPRSNFGHRTNRGLNPRKMQMGVKWEMRANQNVSQTKQNKSYADATRQNKLNKIMKVIAQNLN